MQKVREEIRPPAPEECPKPKKKSDDDCSSDDDTFVLPIGDLLLGVILFPCHAIKHASDDPHLFLPFPYSQGEPGLMWPKPPDDALEPEGPAPIVRGWLARFSVDESNDFQGLNRVNGRLLLDSACAIGLQLNWSYLDERLDNGRHDTLTIGDADVVFRLVQCPAAQWRAGFGARWATDVPDTAWGFNFTTGFDWFPIKPVVVSADVDLGTLRSAGVFHGRITGGVVWNRFEFFTGYDYLQIGCVDLQGPVLGLRAWF